jgi:hypothetical protein
MKKITFTIVLFAFLTLVCALFITGCEPDQEETLFYDISWLPGTWSNSGASFTIAADLTFTCIIEEVRPGDSSKGQVKGLLDKSASGLGPYDFLLMNMETLGTITNFPGNTTLMAQLSGFNALLVTLTPDITRTKFTFSAGPGLGQAAEMFFGEAGPYFKSP